MALLRLRLCIRRNALPDARIVFAADVHDDSTVAQLLEQVHDVVPLESAAWGLDDYAVEIDGYECLHYQRVLALFEKDQAVVIRPRTSEEIKKQRLGGRRQITSDGRHLVDGVPFGRPLLKRPARPVVHIPPLKKRRTGELDDGDDGDDDDDNDALYEDRLQIEYPHDEEDEESAEEEEEDYDEEDDDEEDDGGYDEDEIDSHASDNDSNEDPDDELEALKRDQEQHDDRSSQTPPKTRVRFHVPTNGDADPGDDDDDDDDDGGGEQDDDAMNDGISDAGEDSNHIEAWLDAAISSNGDADGSPGDDDDDSSRPSPGNGKAQTKKRNARRRMKRAMERAVRQTGAAEGNGHGATEANGHDSDAPSEEATTQKPNGTSKTKTKRTPWQDRIRHRAVECWDEGVTLDDPPFPFVQRWGEQKKKQVNGSRKKPAVKDDTTSDESSSSSDSSSDSSDSDSDSSDDEDFAPNGEEEDEEVDDDGDEDADEDDASDKPMTNGHTNGTKATTPDVDDDLPPLPADVASLPPLQRAADAVPGTVLVWGKWTLSEKTAWQPVVVTVTGLVLAVGDDDVLHVRLAARDRERPEKMYDAETGERVYGKFELPGEGDDEDDEEEEDNGEMDVPFGEMMEPRVLQAAVE